MDPCALLSGTIRKPGDEAVIAKWDPATADLLRQAVALTERQANAKRRKKRPQESK